MLLAQRFIPTSTGIPALEGFLCHNARILWSAPDHNTMHAPRPPSPALHNSDHSRSDYLSSSLLSSSNLALSLSIMAHQPYQHMPTGTKALKRDINLTVLF